MINQEFVPGSQETATPLTSERASEIERFERNLESWLKLDPADVMYHRFQGMLESQIVTLQICQVITRHGAVKLLTRLGEAKREQDAASAGDKGEGLRLV